MLVLGKVFEGPLPFPKSRVHFLQYKSSTGGLALPASKVTRQIQVGLSCPLSAELSCLSALHYCLAVGLRVASQLFIPSRCISCSEKLFNYPEEAIQFRELDEFSLLALWNSHIEAIHCSYMEIVAVQAGKTFH